MAGCSPAPCRSVGTPCPPSLPPPAPRPQPFAGEPTMTLPSDCPLRFVLFVHSLTSDWNHGNAHFLRGITRELMRRGHHVAAWEPVDGWSLANLLEDQGFDAIRQFREAFPDLAPIPYDPATLDLDRALDGADVVLVHEWNDPRLVRALGERRARGGRFRLLFHDTHHRALTDPKAMNAFDLSAYDGVLA